MSLWTSQRARYALEETITEATRRTAGFRGSLTLLSIDNPGVGVIITLWANENTLKAYAKGVFVATAGKLERFVTGPPEVKQFRAFSAEFKH